MSLDLGTCPRCGRQLAPTDYQWSNGENESGTGFYEINIVCIQCGWSTEISGWGGIDGLEDLSHHMTQFHQDELVDNDKVVYFRFGRKP